MKMGLRLRSMLLLPRLSLIRANPADVFQKLNYVSDVPSFSRSIKVIVRVVAALGFSIDMCRIAALRRRLAAVSANPLDRGYIAQLPASGMAHHIHQEPRDRSRIERVHVRRRLSGYFASIGQLPRRARKMMPNHFIFAVM